MGGSQSTVETKRKISLKIPNLDGNETVYKNEDVSTWTGSIDNVKKIVKEDAKQFVNDLITAVEGTTKMDKCKEWFAFSKTK